MIIIKTRLKVISLVLIFSILVSSCSSLDSQPLSTADIVEAVSSYNITPLITRETSSTTVILFRRGGEVGCLYGSKRRFGPTKAFSIRTSFQPFFKRNIANDPVVVIQTKSLQEENYCVLINEPDLQKRTKSIGITYTNGVEARFEKDDPLGGVFFRYTDQPSSTYSRVMLYDENGNEILFVTPEQFSR